MVSWSNHVRLGGSDRCHLIIEVIEDGLIDIEAIGNRGIRKKPLNLFLEPVISISYIASYEVSVMPKCLGYAQTYGATGIRKS